LPGGGTPVARRIRAGLLRKNGAIRVLEKASELENYWQ